MGRQHFKSALRTDEEITVSDQMDGISIESGELAPQQELAGDLLYEPLDFFLQKPFEPETFRNEMSFLLQKVKQAFEAMKEDLLECEADRDLLSSTLQLDIWERLIVEIGAMIECIGSPERLRPAIHRCAVSFYRDLMDPIRSIKLFDYLLHLDPADPDIWGSYGLCLIEMSEQCIFSTFDMERRSVFCFVRAARLCLAHLIARDRWLEDRDDETALRLAGEYYYNASDAYPNPVSRKGMYLTMMLKRMESLPGREGLEGREIEHEGENLTREMQAVLAML